MRKRKQIIKKKCLGWNWLLVADENTQQQNTINQNTKKLSKSRFIDKDLLGFFCTVRAPVFVPTRKFHMTINDPNRNRLTLKCSIGVERLRFEILAH